MKTYITIHLITMLIHFCVITAEFSIQKRWPRNKEITEATALKWWSALAWIIAAVWLISMKGGN